MTRRSRLVLVGNGMAGMRALEELVSAVPDRYEVTVFGDEPHASCYNRILLSPVLSGDKSVEEITLYDRAWYEARGIALLTGERVERIDRARRLVIGARGSEVPYDRLILATGSRPIMLPVEGRDLPGVVSFRDIRDVEVMIDAAHRYESAVVIGGGLLGLEAAYGLSARGMRVTVVHLLDTLMEKQLDAVAAGLLRASLEERGIRLRMEAKTERVLGDDRVRGVRFADGTELECDLVVMAVGIRPNVELAQASGLACDRGVLVNDVMQTFDPRVYAVGECVQHRGETFGLVAPLYEQARVVANQLAEDGYFRYRSSVTCTRLKVTGIDVFSAGELSGGEGAEEIVLTDPGRGVYRKLVLREGRIAGAVLFGDVGAGSWYFQLMKEGRDVSELRDGLIFGPEFAANENGGGGSLADVPDDATICDCNGVCKGALVSAITNDGLTTLAQVKKRTKAAASCGSCSDKVEALLAIVQKDAFRREEAPPMCGCTDLGHDAVRAKIVEGRFETIPDAMRALGWQRPDGCASCRPALNYYLLCARPGEYADDSRSRFINERVHANIQKDGTYSVVPRIFGGVTTPAQLRAIADVAEKFAIPSVKITGGQRIDLLGVKKEDLPAVWAELGKAGFVSGHAYAKGLRTVKTCVGEEWCRFGLGDSTRLGIELEQAMWGSWAPHKVKLAVSGCPRNCAEATIKDIGVIAVDGGWELYVGGNGGMKVRAADRIARAATHEEVIEIASAFMQLYREEGRYLERTAPYVERVGLPHIRAKVVEDLASRAALYARFEASQKSAQVDPWAERAGGADAHEFVPLSRLVRREESAA